MKSSFQDAAIPSAILTDGGAALIPLFAVTSMTLSESYHLPPIGSSAARAMVETHDDTISLSAVLPGPQRYVWKLMLETAAESALRGSVLARIGAPGLILVTAQTIRTDIYIQSLSFSQSAAKRQTIDVSIQLVHLPRPGALAKALDVASVAVGALLDPLAH